MPLGYTTIAKLILRAWNRVNGCPTVLTCEIDTAEKWFEEIDPAGFAFEHEALE
jgi:hypothetical protein